MSAPAVLIRSATETNPNVPNVAANEAAAAAAAAGTAIYYVPRRFDKDSKLHIYLAHKCPGLISLRKFDYNLYQVLLALKRVIASEKLYDPQNPTVILCDESLENAINVKALHVSEIRELVCKQFHPILNESDDSKSNLTSCPNTTSSQSELLGGQPPNHAFLSVPVLSTPTPTANLNQNTVSNGLTRSLTAPPATAAAESARIAGTPAAISASQDHVLPSWASSTANAVTARFNSNANTPFDIEAKYWVKPAFLKVLRLVEGVNQSQLVFPYREVTNILSKYIMVNKDRFFDLRNIRIALVENDPLGEAFGVKAFARSQVTSLLRAQLIPYTEPVQPAPQEDNDSKENDDKKRKRDLPSDAESSSADEDEAKHLLRQALKRQRRRSCNVSVTILNCSTSGADSSSSSEETIYSAQGYETAAMRDEADSSEDDSDESRSDSNVASSPLRREQDDYDYGEENVYRVEYEIDDGSEDENGKNEGGNSAEDSDIEDVLIASAVTSLLNDIESSDFSNWADSGSEFSSDDSSDFVLSDPELQGDVWKCVKCNQPNTPYMRYCHRCWEERKGWVPERAKPRRRKRTDKKTEGIPIKSRKYRNNESDAETSGEDVEAADAACNSKSVRLERSLSHPCKSTAAADSLMTQRASPTRLSDGDVEDGAFREGLSETKSGSQSSIDSGFSQESQVDSGSQEFLSEENESGTKSGKEIEIVSSCQSGNSSKRGFAKDLESDDSGNDQKRKRKTLNLDFSKKKRMSPKAKKEILSRMEELPFSIYQQREHIYHMLSNASSVFLTPDTDTCSPSSSQLTRTSTLSTSSPASLCSLCCLRPKDACFIHGKISHQVCCYQCAKTVFNSRGTCPVCRRRIEKITRNICV